MKKAKIISSSFVRGRISKDIEIELSSKVIITANKWALWDDVEGDDSDWDWVDEDDSDWDWVDEESRKRFDELSESAQEEVKELINNFKLKL